MDGVGLRVRSRHGLLQGTTAMTMGVVEFGRYIGDEFAWWVRIGVLSGAKAE